MDDVLRLSSLFERILWNGIIPENAVSSVIVPFALKYWKGIVFSVGHNNFRGLETGYYELRGDAGTSIPLDIIANASARLKYMKMYREEIGENSVIEDMVGNDYSKTCLFDFERPWSNIVYFPYSNKSFARLDIWRRFQKRLSQEHLAQYEAEDVKRFPLYLDRTNLEMWENKESRWLINIQKEIMQSNIGRGDYFEFASMVAESSMPPRVLTRFMQDDSFPSTYNGIPGVVDLVGDVSKVKELLFICKNVQQKRRVDYGIEFLPRGERLYLELLHKALTCIEKNFKKRSIMI